MRILLDTNVIIHREANSVVLREIGNLFNWLDRLHHEKCVHPFTLDEISKHADPKVVATFKTKIDSYNVLKTLALDTPEILAIQRKYDKTDNDEIDTAILKEVYANRVDLLITEDKKIHAKAMDLNISTKVFTIEAFLEKVTAENPTLVDYKVLAVKKSYFGNINLKDAFFDSFRRDYNGFDAWFNKKSDEIAYICEGNSKDMLAFLYVKLETEMESYIDIEPKFEPKRRMKIGTFKVIANGFKLGERFLKIVFDNALRLQVDEIYLTIFENTEDQKRLVDLIHDWGFKKYGVKSSKNGEESVYVRDFRKAVDLKSPNLTYPYFSRHKAKFIVPIYPEYHTNLLPDSILNTESPMEYIDNVPNRNAISKVYVSRSIERNLNVGDIIVFYRTKDEGKGFYRSVTTTIGIVQNTITKIPNLQTFKELCRRRSVFSDIELEENWNRNLKYPPFVVNFLYVYSFPKRLNLKELMELGIIVKAPRGFERLSDSSFEKLMENSLADKRLIAD